MYEKDGNNWLTQCFQERKKRKIYEENEQKLTYTVWIQAQKKRHKQAFTVLPLEKLESYEKVGVGGQKLLMHY